ncbi:TypA [Desulforapulum autotrophicum HRM2]|uniref:Large ribosomal subunit assembly factor BipA n=1 Tax=Desulforapulum autotrophicum (strain ATCC 43914 / DSM 3382 / VKM B-1955 / HRM2) TaxID=177437 RepID=C0QAQ4_DESAH|nr:translational GTPase TypA [Desulforapulum autotrophicum]ACN16837.1 TypA [Desulforapulum autotrophicum HRM2]
MKNKSENKNIRNIAIIAHVDHGKTTLVDAMFKQSGTFRLGKEVDDRIMDSMDLERERGITISAKNCSVVWKKIKINILDTPGHADFSAEVERALSMVNGAILLVDASEGPLPQTRFVLKKALAAGLRIIVVINKIDRPDARVEEVLDEIYDLFIDLDATDDQIDFPVLYAIGKNGVAKKEMKDESQDLKPLFDTILNKIPAPKFDPDEPFQMLVSDLGHSDYTGRLAIGKIANGQVSSKDELVVIGKKGIPEKIKVSSLQAYEGASLSVAEHVQPGDIAVVSGTDSFEIGDTICTKEFPKALPRIAVDEPTISMMFTISNSPFSGLEGKLVQSSRIRERLEKESLANVAISVENTVERDRFIVKGRGEFQMAILVETMRREGFELCVGRPEVIFKTGENGEKLEPVERLYVDCEEAFTGIVTEKLSIRKARMVNLVNKRGRANIEFSTPSRSLIGYRDEFLTDTKGTGIMNSIFSGYEPFRGDFPTRRTGSLVSDRQGKAVPYALYNLEPRGRLMITPGTPVYEGMIIGEHSKDRDLDVNPCKEKKLTNMRASGKDDATTCSPIKPLTLEQALNFINSDELVEVTPKTVRVRKRILSKQKR